MNEFKITGNIHITDPCYNIKTWCGIYNQKAKTGTWIGTTIDNSSEDRTNELIVHHKDHPLNTLSFESIAGDVGVDSGQAGVFNAEHYPKGVNDGEAKDMNTFYGRACRETCPDFDKEHAKEKQVNGLSLNCGVVDEHGFVSDSGYGDGNYEALGAYEGDKLVAVKIIFIDEEAKDAGEDGY